MRRLAAALTVAVLVSGCGGPSDTLEGDLAAASEIVQVPAAALEPVARDRYGFTSSNSEATLDVFAVDASTAKRLEVFEAPRSDPIEFVRNPVSLGALVNVLDSAETIVVILIPLIDPTRDFLIAFDARLISLDGSGSVIASDYPDAADERLDDLFEYGQAEGLEPAEILAIAAQGVNAESRTAQEDRAVAILFGG